MVIKPIKFLINYFTKSFELGIDENFKLLADDSNGMLKSIFSVISSLYKLEKENTFEWKDEYNHIMFLISCLFLTLCLKSSTWDLINQRKLIKPCCDCIKIFIHKTFSRNFDKNNDKTYINLDLIKLLCKILGYISRENVYRKIYHIGFYGYIFDFILDLFIIDYPAICIDVYSIFNICTYYNSCKAMFFEVQDFPKFRNHLFERILSSINDFNSVKHLIDSNEKFKVN